MVPQRTQSPIRYTERGRFGCSNNLAPILSSVPPWIAIRPITPRRTRHNGKRRWSGTNSNAYVLWKNSVREGTHTQDRVSAARCLQLKEGLAINGGCRLLTIVTVDDTQTPGAKDQIRSDQEASCDQQHRSCAIADGSVRNGESSVASELHYVNIFIHGASIIIVLTLWLTPCSTIETALVPV